MADAAEATAPPSGAMQVTGRLLPSEAHHPSKPETRRRATAVSVAELIDDWEVAKLQELVAATAEVAGGADVSAAARPGEPPAAGDRPQPPAQQIDWLNLFLSLESVVFAGFAFFIWWRLVKDDYHRDLEAPSTATPKRVNQEQAAGATPAA